MSKYWAFTPTAQFQRGTSIKTCCSKMHVDFRDEKPAENAGILIVPGAFRWLFSRKDIWQVRILRFLEAPKDDSERQGIRLNIHGIVLLAKWLRSGFRRLWSWFLPSAFAPSVSVRALTMQGLAAQPHDVLHSYGLPHRKRLMDLSPAGAHHHHRVVKADESLRQP